MLLRRLLPKRLISASTALWFAMAVLLTLALRPVLDGVSWTSLLPQHYRSMVLVVLALWLWGLNLHLLEKSGIHAQELLQIHTGTRLTAAAATTTSTATMTTTTTTTTTPDDNDTGESFPESASAVSPVYSSRHHRDVYRLAFGLTIVVGLIIWVSSFLPTTQSTTTTTMTKLTNNKTSTVENSTFHLDLNVFTSISFVALLCLLVCPWNVLVKRERFRFIV